MDWGQHIKMDYAQNLKKDPVKAKKGPLQNSYRVLSAHFAVLHYIWLLTYICFVNGFQRWVLIEHFINIFIGKLTAAAIDLTVLLATWFAFSFLILQHGQYWHQCAKCFPIIHTDPRYCQTSKNSVFLNYISEIWTDTMNRMNNMGPFIKLYYEIRQHNFDRHWLLMLFLTWIAFYLS